MNITPRRFRTTTDLLSHQDGMAQMGRSLILAKNRDYGDSANSDPFANFRRHGLVGIIVRMDDKLARLSTFAKTGSLTVKDEGFIDTCIDLMNYAAIAVAFELDNQARKQEEANNEVSQLTKGSRAGSVTGSGSRSTASEGVYPAELDSDQNRIRSGTDRKPSGGSGVGRGANPESAQVGYATRRDVAVERLYGKSFGDLTIREIVDYLGQLGCRP